MDPVPRKLERGRDTKLMPRSRDQQAPSWNTRQGAAPFGGRVSQVSFHDGKLLVFERNDSPLARGRLQNAKWKEQVRTHSISELPNLSQKPERLARENIGAAEKAFCGQRGRFVTYGHPRGGGGAFVGNTYDRRAHGFPQYGKYFGDFSTLWKIIGRFFHAMERMFPQCGKLGFRSVFGGFRAVRSGLLERSARRPM